MIYLLIGLIVGFWAKDVWVKLTYLYNDKKEQRAIEQAGVVKPSRRPVTNMQYDDGETGGVKRPTPTEVIMSSSEKREEILRNNHR